MSPVELDFRLTVTGLMNDAAYSVELGSSVSGVRIASVSPCPFDRRLISQETLQRLRSYTTGIFPQEQLVSLGNTLSDLLLPAAIRDALLVQLQQHPTAPITLRLKIVHRDLAALPWEFLRLKAADGILPEGWLFQNDRITLRREFGGAIFPPALPTDQWRALIVWADPCSVQFPSLPHLSAEVGAIRTVLNQQGVQHITELRHATPGNLREELQELQPHLLHFIGHGQQRPNGGRLILSGEEPNSEEPLAADVLASWLAKTQVRLVTLATCDTLDVAETLTERGVPAVIGMQWPLADDLAVPFAHHFYASLLQPLPVTTSLADTGDALRASNLARCAPTLLESVESAQPITAPLIEEPFYVPIPRNPEFVGRSTLLKRIHRSFSSDTSPRVIALSGMGGMGKTQVAAEYAHCYRESYPGGVFWITSATSQSVLEGLEWIGRLHFGAPDDMIPQQVAAFVRESLQNLARPALVLYDNVAWENEATLAEKVKPELFLPLKGLCRALLTTRDHLLSPPYARIFDGDLTLETADALALLTKRRMLIPEEHQAAEMVLELTGALPLALVLASHHIQRSRSTFKEYREYLERSRSEISTRAWRDFHGTTKHNGMIFRTIAISYDALEPSHHYILAVLASFNRQNISPDLLFKASGIHNRWAFNNLLANLIDCAMLRREEAGGLTLHDLVRTFVLCEQTPEIHRFAANAVTDFLKDRIPYSIRTKQGHTPLTENPHKDPVSNQDQTGIQWIETFNEATSSLTTNANLKHIGKRYSHVQFPRMAVVGKKEILEVQLTIHPTSPSNTTVIEPPHVSERKVDETVMLSVVVTSPAFSIAPQYRSLMVRPNEDTLTISFDVTPISSGEQAIDIEFYRDADRIGYLIVSTTVMAND